MAPVDLDPHAGHDRGEPHRGLDQREPDAERERPLRVLGRPHDVEDEHRHHDDVGELAAGVDDLRQRRAARPARGRSAERRQHDEGEREGERAPEAQRPARRRAIDHDGEQGEPEQDLDRRGGSPDRVVERAGEREEAGVGALAEHDHRDQQADRHGGPPHQHQRRDGGDGKGEYGDPVAQRGHGQERGACRNGRDDATLRDRGTRAKGGHAGTDSRPEARARSARRGAPGSRSRPCWPCLPSARRRPTPTTLPAAARVDRCPGPPRARAGRRTPPAGGRDPRARRRARRRARAPAGLRAQPVLAAPDAPRGAPGERVRPPPREADGGRSARPHRAMDGPVRHPGLRDQLDPPAHRQGPVVRVPVQPGPRRPDQEQLRERVAVGSRRRAPDRTRSSRSTRRSIPPPASR